jgi:hypothetical protein
VSHTRILPHIQLPGKVESVPAEFHQKALILFEVTWLGNLLVQEPVFNVHFAYQLH